MDPSTANLNRLSPSALAYIGDAVYELHVRMHYLYPPQRTQTYHRLVVEQVRAEAQAQQLQVLLPVLTEAEQAIVRRGRNAASSPPKRLSANIYRQASGFETLVGYLYLAQPARLQELLQLLPLAPPA
ncbi:MAG: ribonuclease III domain-containing protein [Cyanobacteria bacterium P01_A01_bin.135]